MGNLKKDRFAKPTPKNRVSVLFIFSLAAVLAVIGISARSYFGQKVSQAPATVTASTEITAAVKVRPESVDNAATSPQMIPEEVTTKPEILDAQSPKPEATPKNEVEEDNNFTEEFTTPSVSNINSKPPAPLNEPSPVDVETTEKSIPDALFKESTPSEGEVEANTADVSESVNSVQDEARQTEPQIPTLPTPDTEGTEGGAVAMEKILPAPIEEHIEHPKTLKDTGSLPQRVKPPALSEQEEKTEKTVVEKVAENAPKPDMSPEATILADEDGRFDERMVEPAPVEPTAKPVDTLEPTDTPITTAQDSPVVEQMPAWKEFAVPFHDIDDLGRIAIVISEVGMNAKRTQKAIQDLPAAFTLAFNPYGNNLQNLVDQARSAGHEILLQLPMEPLGYPNIDPGPQALRTDLSEEENLSRLTWLLNRFTGYVGFTNQMGSKFTATAESLHPVLEVIKEKGFLYLDSRTSSNSVAAAIAEQLDIPVAINNRFLDHKADGALIDARLKELEKIALETGSAVGIAYPHDETFRHLSDWAKTLDKKGLVLAPITAVIK